MNISLVTAKRFLRLLRSNGVRITRRSGRFLKLMGAGGAVTLIPGVRAMAIEKGAPFTTVIHEYGHLMDFDCGNRWLRLWQKTWGRHYAAEIAANRRATELLRSIGDESDVEAFRWAALAQQLLCRRKQTGRLIPVVNPSDYQTKARIIKKGSRKFLMVVITSPRRLHIVGPGEYADLSMFSKISVQWSGDLVRWQSGKFRHSVGHESRQSDAAWIYRLESKHSIAEFPSQYARLKIKK